MEGSASKEKTVRGEKDGHARSRLHRRPRNLDLDLAQLPGQPALKTPSVAVTLVMPSMMV